MTGPTPLDPGFYDAELRAHNRHLRAAAGVGPGDHVLDVGCGTGETTRDAGRAAVDGSATGVDISVPMLEHARRLTEAEGLRNVAYERGDAQTHRFPHGHFDLCISRCGAMFFTDPVAAFANIGRSMRGDARLILLVWQDPERNEWFTAPREALRGPNPPAPAASHLRPFSLADPATTKAMLTSAGFVDIGFTDVREPVYYGATRDASYDTMLRLPHARDLVADLDVVTADDARGRLRAMLGDHETDDGVLLDSAAWIVTARRH
jgi:SAM-dependent methyltransferase